MSKVKIFHNPECSKSCQTLSLLQQQNIQVEIIEYLKIPPTISQLGTIIDMCAIAPRALIRKNEDIYIELGLSNLSLSDDQLIHAMCENPKLIERPIVINNGQAKIGRPPEVVLDIL